MQFFIQVLVIALWVASIGWITGKKEYPVGPNDDERKKMIKDRSMIQSWLTLLLFLLTNFLFDRFNINEDVPSLSSANLELFYLIVALISYFIFYLINSRKLSA